MASRRTRSTRPACLSFLPGLLLPDELQTMVLEAAVVKPAEKEGERASLDLKPWAMLALTNAHWADHIREMLIPQLWRMQKLQLYASTFLWRFFDAVLTATTLRMPPAALVDWLGALSTQKLQETKRKDDDEEDTTLGWLTDHCGLIEVGNAQSHLLRKAAWTPELLVKATSILVTPRFDDLQESGYAAYDVSMVVNDVAAKTHSSISSLAIGSVAAKAPDTKTKAFYLINIYGSFVDGSEFDICGAKKLGATLADLTRSGQASPADIVAVAHQLQEEELMTREWAPDFMQESPFAWSRAALLAWASRADTSRWSRRDKRELLRSKGALLRPASPRPCASRLPTACAPASQVSASGSRPASTTSGPSRSTTTTPPTSILRRPPSSPPTSASSLPSSTRSTT